MDTHQLIDEMHAEVTALLEQEKALRDHAFTDGFVLGCGVTIFVGAFGLWLLNL